MLSLAGEFPLAGERSLAGDSSLGGVVEEDGTSDQLPGAPDMAALLLHKSTSKKSITEKALMRARQQKANSELTLGAALGAALRSD